MLGTGSSTVTELAPQSRMMVLLFTDIVGSVDLKTRLGDAVAGRIISRHDGLFNRAMEAFPGAEILKDTGDGFLARFATVSDAVCFSLLFQHAMRQEDWQNQKIEVRIGLHLGEVSELEKERTGHAKLTGLAVDIAARVMGLARGGQILMTRAPFDNARQYVREHPPVGTNGHAAPELKWMAHGAYVFKGSDEPLEVFEVGAVGIAPLREPPDGEKSKRAVRPGEEEMLGWRPGAGLEVPGRTGWFLKHRLGEGGFGEVWLGEQKKTRVRRAFKFCYDYDRLRSLKRELTLFRLLREVLGDRPDIARLFEVRLDKAPYFLECEFTELGDLRDWSDALGGLESLSLETRIELVSRTAKAVAAAHSVGVLHKDIKPSNILIYEAEDQQPRPRLADFGIGVLTDPSQLHGHDITVEGFTEMLAGNESSRTGTRLYAPPETIVGKPFTVQGDIYALGVLLYQMVIADMNRPLASGWEREVSDPLLREDIARCVAGDEKERAGSAQELVDRLEQLPERRAQARRRRLTRLAAIAASAAVIVLSIASAILYRELHAARQLEEARELTRIVDGFLLDNILHAADPSQQGYEVTLAQALPQISVDAAAAFKDQPRLEAAVRRRIGHTFKELDRYDEAAQELNRALELNRAQFRGAHADTADSLIGLADVLWFQNEYELAKAHYDEALAMRRELFGDESAAVAECINGQAACLFRMQRFEEAEPLFRRALAIRLVANQTEGRDQIAAAQNNLAKFLLARQQYGEAGELLQSALNTVRSIAGEEHYDYARAMTNLADLYAAQRNYDEAERLQRAALEIKRRVGGESHVSVANSHHLLAQLNLDRARTTSDASWLARAEEDCRIAVRIRAGLRGGRNPDHARSLSLLGEILMEAGRAADATQPLRECVAILESMPLPPEDVLSNARELLARCEAQAATREPQLGLAPAVLAALANTLPMLAHPDVALERIILAGHEHQLELAADELSRARGLGGRRHIDPLGGMLFVFPDSRRRTFWMLDCVIDIDIAFVNHEGRIVALHRMTAEAPRRESESRAAYERRLNRYDSHRPARFAIELAADSIDRLQLKVGQKLDHDWDRLRRLAEPASSSAR